MVSFLYSYLNIEFDHCLSSVHIEHTSNDLKSEVHSRIPKRQLNCGGTVLSEVEKSIFATFSLVAEHVSKGRVLILPIAAVNRVFCC